MRLARADAQDVTLRGVAPRVSRGVSPRTANRASSHRGFTLLEMLAVVVLLAIALTAVSMSVSKSLSSAKVRAVSRDLVASLRYTRGQAIVKGEQKTFDVDLEAMTYTAPGKDPQKFPDGIEVRVLTAAQEATSERKLGIRFFPDGSSTGGNIGVHSGEREWRVNVEWLTGEVALDEVHQ